MEKVVTGAWDAGKARQSANAAAGSSMGFLPVFVAAGVLRAILIGVSVIQDYLAEVPYTDIDYQVFSEAAENIVLRLSPYDNRTALLNHPDTRYRYTPLLAYILLPNIWFHPAWGKILFSFLDLVAGRLLLAWFRVHSPGKGNLHLGGLVFWLFNPFTFTISTRGSCESVVVLLIYLALHNLCIRQSIPLAAFFFALAVHWRIYPVVYALPLVLRAGEVGFHPLIGWRRLFSSEALRFAGISVHVFVALFMLFTAVYGDDFIHSTYLYHATRVDTQHNFSIYFYPLRFFPQLAKFATAPQLLACFFLGWTSTRGPVAPAILLQTLAFVMLNRVITAQYHVWWLALLPPALPWLRVDSQLGWALGFWALGEVHWLGWAYLLEFRKMEVAPLVWGASCVFFLSHLNLLRTLRRPILKSD